MRDDLPQPLEVYGLLEALHDMSRPVEVLAAVRAALAADGRVCAS